MDLRHCEEARGHLLAYQGDGIDAVFVVELRISVRFSDPPKTLRTSLSWVILDGLAVNGDDLWSWP